MNAPKRARATKRAEPIANPLPIAAVVLPAASSSSVYSLTDGSRFDISAIPPALSAIGPNPSTERHTGKVPSMPSAAKATPYIAAHLKERSTVSERQQMGITFDI
jgi:broad specificity phosphatase PhoE